MINQLVEIDGMVYVWLLLILFICSSPNHLATISQPSPNYCNLPSTIIYQPNKLHLWQDIHVQIAEIPGHQEAELPGVRGMGWLRSG